MTQITFRTEQDHLKTNVRLAFERALNKTPAHNKLTGRVYRTLLSTSGIKRHI